MKFFGSDKEERIEELETELDEKDKQIESLTKQLEAEKERRKKHTREKQEAQEKINRLKDRIEGLESREKSVEEGSQFKREKVGFEAFKRTLEKLDRIEGDATVYSPDELRGHPDLEEIKNTIPESAVKLLLDEDRLILIYDQDLGPFVFKTRPFFEPTFSKRVDIRPVTEFVEKDKTWVKASRGATRIVEEQNGNVKSVEKIKSRVNRQHGKGGFSQDRFERRRQEQIEDHITHVREELGDENEIFLLGDKELCGKLPGKWLGGFDPNSTGADSLYQIQRIGLDNSM